jgi:hypothetical protein
MVADSKPPCRSISLAGSWAEAASPEQIKEYHPGVKLTLVHGWLIGESDILTWVGQAPVR